MNRLNSKNTLILLILIFTNPVLSGTALVGDYTIGGTTPDYATISAAVADLNTDGISGPVNFLIRSGSYNEQVTITNFTRTLAAATDQVTFSSAGSNVDWFYTSVSIGSEWVLKLDGASYITFLDLDFHSLISGFGDLVYFEGESNNITIEGCVFDGQASIGNLIFQNTVGNHANNHFYFNSFSQGAVAIDIDYIFGGFDSTGLEISDNIFTNQSSKSVETGSVNLIIKRNKITAGTLSNSDYIAFDIKDNQPTIENNTFNMINGQAAIWIDGLGINTETRIINNMIALDTTTANTAGIYVDSTNVSIYHNTVRSNSATAPALYIAGSSLDVRIQNNILVNNASNLALKIVDADSISISDYNNIYSTGNPVVSWDGMNFSSLFIYVPASGLDNNSIEQSVSFVNTAVGVNDLHLAAPNNNDVDFLAPTLASVNTDFDGDSRGLIRAYKGADEGAAISPLDNADVGGFYTVGGTNPDYLTPNFAIIDLKQRGMKGPVTFRIRAGLYTTHQNLTGINRSGNANDLLTFRAADFNNPPTIRYNATNDTNNWVIKIQDMNYIDFNHVNFLTTSASIYGQLLVIEGDSNNIKVRDSIFTGLIGQTSDESSLVSATNVGLDNYEFTNNQFNNGNIALNFITPNPFTVPQGKILIVESNTFSQQSVNTLVSNHDNIDFNENIITSSFNNFNSLQINFNIDTQIGKNKFLLTGTNSTAINLKGADGISAANPSIISNNFIKASNGINVNEGSNTIYMYYNTVVATVLPINVQAYVNESYSLQLINNILINNGSGSAIFIAENVLVTESNYNNFINGSGALIDWQASQYTTLADFQNATSFDASSTTTPMFFSDIINANFHLALTSIANTSLTGTPLIFISDDFDSDARTDASPYMGADQVAGAPLINTYSVGGMISGLTVTNPLVLQNNSNDNLTVDTNGNFTFNNLINDGEPYNVTILTEPNNPNQICAITNGSNNVAGNNVENIVIVCETQTYSVGGFVINLEATNTLVVQNNNSNNLIINENGLFTFSTELDNTNSYSVTVSTQPNNPIQDCQVSNSSGDVPSFNITNISINCAVSDVIFKNGFEDLIIHFSLTNEKNISSSTAFLGNGISAQVIPTLNIYWLMFMILLFVFMVRRKIISY